MSKKIGIIGAMPSEVETLIAQMENDRPVTVASCIFHEGKLGGQDVVAVRGGCGKVAAALCAQIMILRFGVDLLINTGTAGTLSDKLSIGDIAVSENVVEWDMDTSAVGDPVGYLSGPNIIYVPADKALTQAVTETLDALNEKYVVGTICSGDTFVANSDLKRRIAENFNGIACEMEGAAVGHVCYVNKVPFVVIRAVSDGGNEAVQMDYPTFVKIAAAKSAEMVIALLKRL